MAESREGQSQPLPQTPLQPTPNPGAAQATAGQAVAQPPAGLPPLVELRGLRKQYPGTLAVDFDPDELLAFYPGEIRALVGENGAGKSTLVSMIAGVVAPTGGEMLLDGKPYAPHDAAAARALGVDIVFQESGLVETMSVEDNLVLGRERAYAKRVMFNPRTRHRLARAAIAPIAMPPRMLRLPAARLNPEERKFVELARALSLDPRVLVIDEMTASLSRRGVPILFEMLRGFAARGGLVIYISHHLEEVFELCDRVTVMKDGRLVRTLETKKTDQDQLSTLMVGRRVRETLYRSDAESRAQPEVLLEARGLGVAGRFSDVSFTLNRGEIVGVGGLIGCGSETLARVLFGDVHPTSGELLMHGRKMDFRHPSEAIAHGIGLVPGDRDREGLVLGLSLKRNIALASLPHLSRLGMVGPRREGSIARRLINQLRIVCRGPDDLPFNLSGGNRQKAVLAKWLIRDIEVLVLHNPTRGVDVGGKSEIYNVIHDLAARGVAVLLVSDDLPELIGLSDKVVIMRRGQVSGRVARNEGLSEELLIGYML